jgi:hypothetical protein
VSIEIVKEMNSIKGTSRGPWFLKALSHSLTLSQEKLSCIYIYPYALCFTQTGLPSSGLLMTGPFYRNVLNFFSFFLFFLRNKAFNRKNLCLKL